MSWIDMLVTTNSSYTSKARNDAFSLHSGQFRKYTGEPYIHHNAEMVGMFYSLNCDELDEQQLDEGCSIIWLHDVMEDCGVTYETLASEYSAEICSGVRWLSDIDQVGNRAERKRQTRERLAKAPSLIQTIKCLDLWSNLTSVMLHDKKFAVVFVAEAEQLLQESLVNADSKAIALVQDLLTTYRQNQSGADVSAV